jgi:hypothetical protein
LRGGRIQTAVGVGIGIGIIVGIGPQFIATPNLVTSS